MASRRSRHLVLTQIFALGALLIPRSAPAEEAEGAEGEQTTVMERMTATTFEIHREISGEPHVLIGVGARRAGQMLNIYGAGLYVGEEGAVEAWRGRLPALAKLGRDDEGELDYEKIAEAAEARRFAILDRFPRAIELAFVRDVTADHLKSDFQRGWDVVGLDREAAGEALPRFMKAVDLPVDRGERVLIRTTPNQEIHITTPDGEARIEGNRALITSLWEMWVGNPCLQPSLRRGLLSLLRNVNELVGGR